MLLLMVVMGWVLMGALVLVFVTLGGVLMWLVYQLVMCAINPER